MKSDVVQVEAFLRYIYKPEDVFELRGIGTVHGQMRGLFQGDFAKAAAAGVGFSDECGGHSFFCLNTINPASPKLVNRTLNRLVRFHTADKKHLNLVLDDSDRLGRRLLLIDVDPYRPKDPVTGKSPAATSAQRVLSRNVAEAIQAHLASEGWPEPIMCDSGNGVHLLFQLDGSRIETPMISAVLHHLGKLYDQHEAVKVDTGVADLGRVARLYGTWNPKGEGRLSCVTSYPADRCTVPVEKLLALAVKNGYLTPEVRRAKRAVVSDSDAITDFDVETLISDDYPNEFPLKSIPDWDEDGSQRYFFEQCPNVGRQHELGGNQFLALSPDGSVRFLCFAENCRNTTFPQLLRNIQARTGRPPSCEKMRALMLRADRNVTADLEANNARALAVQATRKNVEYGLVNDTLLRGAIAADPLSFPMPSLIGTTQEMADVLGQAIVDKLAINLHASPVDMARGEHLRAPARLPKMRHRRRLYLDFETRSVVDIKKRGGFAYAEDPSTRSLTISYALDGADVTVHDFSVDYEIPADLLAMINDPEILKVAWNCSFDAMILFYCHGIRISTADWLDASVVARYLHIPASLADACCALGLAADKGKDASGKILMKLFSYPRVRTKKQKAAGEPAIWADAFSHPSEWIEYLAYNKQDVIAMRECMIIMDTIGYLPDLEHKLWQVDQIINERGMMLDMPFVGAADDLSDAADVITDAEMKELTGMKNPNSPHQIKQWLKTLGIELPSIAAPAVELFLNPDNDPLAALMGTEATVEIHPDAIKFFALRERHSGAALRKFQAMKDRCLFDGTVKGEFYFYGGHLGRWSGKGVQLQNLAKPSKAMEDRVDEITQSIRAGHGLPADCDPVDALTSVVRSSFIPRPGHLFAISDFSAVENRVLGWASECSAMSDIFRRGLDPYKYFGSKLFKVLYEFVTKQQRNDAKPTTLAAGYQIGAKGLVAQARKYGLKLTVAEAQHHLDVFAKEFPEVTYFWSGIAGAATKAFRKSCAVDYKCFRLDGSDPRFLEIGLPNGRSLFYQDFRVDCEDHDDRAQLSYSKGKFRTRIYGGLLTENVIQAISRDLLSDAMSTCAAEGQFIVGSIHDELIVEALSGEADATRSRMEEIMSTTPVWAPGLLLGAAAHVADYYSKG